MTTDTDSPDVAINDQGPLVLDPTPPGQEPAIGWTPPLPAAAVDELTQVILRTVDTYAKTHTKCGGLIVRGAMGQAGSVLVGRYKG